MKSFSNFDWLSGINCRNLKLKLFPVTYGKAGPLNKPKERKYFKRLTIMIILIGLRFFLPPLVFLVPITSGAQLPPKDPNAPVPIPGLAIILIAGALLGINHLQNKKNKP